VEDQDGDGFVSFSDLYAYVNRQLRTEGKQIPQRKVDGDGDLRVARRGGTVPADGPPTRPPRRRHREIALLDATAGAPLDAPTAMPGQAPDVTLCPGTATSA